MQLKIKIDNEENFVVKPGNCAFGLGVMMCEYQPNKMWKISYPALLISESSEYVLEEFKRHGEYHSKTSDDIIHDLFHYVIPYITCRRLKTWLIEDLIKSEIQSYDTKTPFEIKMAVNYGKVVAIAPKGSADTENKTSYFIWRRDGELVYFNHGLEYKESISIAKGELVKIHGIQNEAQSYLNGKMGRLERKKSSTKWYIKVPEGTKTFSEYVMHPRKLFYVGQDVFVQENEKWIDGNITKLKKVGIEVRKKGDIISFTFDIVNVKEFIEGQKILVKFLDDQWVGTVESTDPLYVTDGSDSYQVLAEWHIERTPPFSAQDLWNLMQTRIPDKKLWKEIIDTAENFFQEKKVRLGRLDIFVPSVGEWWINEAELPGAAQPWWFPQKDIQLRDTYYNYLILSTFNDDKIVMDIENKKKYYELPPAEFFTTKWKEYRKKDGPRCKEWIIQ